MERVVWVFNRGIKKMLETITDTIIIELNLLKIKSRKKGGMLYSIKQNGVTLGEAGTWNKCPVIRTYFSYNSNNGKISEFRHLKAKKIEKPFKQGNFNVAVDWQRLLSIQKAGMTIEIPEYRIVKTFCNKNTSERTKHNLAFTEVEYNARHGFSIEYQDFVIGDAI